MNGRRAVFALCMACALLVSAFVASGAQGVANAVTCKPVTKNPNTKGFSDTRCKSPSENKSNPAEDNVKAEHIDITQATSIGGEPGESFSGQQTLRATINGINTELRTTSVTGSGELEKFDETIEGTGTITYTGVEVVAPAGKGCKVYTDNGGSKGEEGVVHTEKLKGSTSSPSELKFTPASGETFAAFIIDGCTGTEALEGLNKTYSVTGSLIGKVTGAETSSTHSEITTQNTLKLNGSIKSGLNGSLTINGPTGIHIALT
jgi:hypothetical protein